MDFENRWHDHLLAIDRERERGASGKPSGEGGRSKEPPARPGGPTDGRWSLSKGLVGTGDPGAIDKLAPTDRRWAVERLLQPRQAGDCCGRRAKEEGSGLGLWPMAPSMGFRASAGRFLRRSVSNGGDSVVDSCSFRVAQSLATIKDAAGDAPPAAGFSGGETKYRPRSLPRTLSSASSTAAEEPDLSLGLSIGSAFQLMDPVFNPGGAQARSKKKATDVVAGITAAFTSASNPGASDAGAPAARASASSGASPNAADTDTLALSLGLAPRCAPLRARGLHGDHPAFSAGGGSADASKPRAQSMLTKLDFFGSPGAVQAGGEGAGGAIGGGGGGGGGGGRFSPGKSQGRPPSECPCGAAALYSEIIGGDGSASSPAEAGPGVSGGKPGGEAATAQAAEASAAAAHRLGVSKAHAHLLTRGAKAVAYARLQVRSPLRSPGVLSAVPALIGWVLV